MKVKYKSATWLSKTGVFNFEGISDSALNITGHTHQAHFIANLSGGQVVQVRVSASDSVDHRFDSLVDTYLRRNILQFSSCLACDWVSH